MTARQKTFRARATQALQDARLQKALTRVPSGFIEKRAKARAALPEFDALRDEAKRIKQRVLADLDTLLVAFEEAASQAGAQVHWAEDANSAATLITQICQNAQARRITKGKSMISEEIGLAAHLERAGFQVVETDLGEYLVQIRGEAPSHIIAPAIHLTRKEISADFRRQHRNLPEDRRLETPEDMVAEARKVLREIFLSADVGITGANLLVAENGAVCLVTNEGNGDLTQTLPRVHIVVASIEKLVGTMAEAHTLLRLLARSATGQEISTYTTFSFGARRPEDPDGPEACHIVLLDNGRSRLLGTPFEDMLRCIRCGACLNHCPVYGAIGGHAYGWVYPGPMGVVLTPSLKGPEASEDLADACTFCGRCEAVCPLRIPLPAMIRRWRETAFQAKPTASPKRLALRAWAALALRPHWYHRLTGLFLPLFARWGGRKGRPLRRLPFATAWTESRDFPRPEGPTFHQLWRKRQKRTGRGP